MSGIKALVVIYNKPLSESPAIRSINGAQGVQIYIADNSTVDCGNEAFARSHGYRYFDMGGNMGLSCAYNRVISTLEKNDGLICLFDDDTAVGGDYFKVLREDADRFPDIDIFAPVVKDGKGILSPCILHNLAGRRVKSIEELPRYGISAINSGLAVRLRVFNDYRYDEGQFLDYIDHAFIRDITGQDASKIRIMDTVLYQRFMGSESPDRQALLNRYSIFKSDATHFCRRYGIPPLLCGIFLARRRLVIFLKLIFARLRGK